jgi:ribose 5-phosphate isomerase B
MKIVLGSDHGGLGLKEQVKAYLDEENYDYHDIGVDTDASSDYPVYGRLAAEAVASGEFDRGIVFCGTGIGISIAANKVHGIRCALVTNEFMAEMARKHNNANMIALGGRVLSVECAIKLVEIFLNTEFEGDRHKRRVDMLDQM